jgi:hypothetical protein
MWYLSLKNGSLRGGSRFFGDWMVILLLDLTATGTAFEEVALTALGAPFGLTALGSAFDLAAHGAELGFRCTLRNLAASGAALEELALAALGASFKLAALRSSLELAAFQAESWRYSLLDCRFAFLGVWCTSLACK